MSNVERGNTATSSATPGKRTLTEALPAGEPSAAAVTDKKNYETAPRSKADSARFDGDKAMEDVAAGSSTVKTGDHRARPDGSGEIIAIADTGLDCGENGPAMHADFRGRIALLASWPTNATWPAALVLFAAGNDGADRDADGRVDPGSLYAPASAKNALAIGATEERPRSPKPTTVIQGPSLNIVQGELVEVSGDGTPPTSRTLSLLIQLRRANGTPIGNKAISVETDGTPWSFADPAKTTTDAEICSIARVAIALTGSSRTAPGARPCRP